MDAIGTSFKVLYNGKNISEDISLHLLGFSYTDNVSGEADSFEIKLEDVEGKWSNEWYPQKGAELTLSFGNANEPLITPNKFEIDEIKLSGEKESGDIVSIKALSAGINKQLHTKGSHAHENKTLSEIVHTYASKYGLTVVGPISDIRIGRVTQHREKDLTFLNRLADEYGYAFTVKGSKLIFTPLKSLEAINKVTSIDKTDCIDWEISDKGIGVFNQATVKSHNPNQNRTIKSTYTVDQVANKDNAEFTFLKEGNNSLEVRTKTENEQQANAKSEAALHKSNSLQQTATVRVIGNVVLLAGQNIELTGFGRNSGVWHILKSKHEFDKSKSYETEMELKRVVPASVSGSNKKAKTVKAKANTYSVITKKNKDAVTFTEIK